jgi:GNAT superfamily N-acetyltransferase
MPSRFMHYSCYEALRLSLAQRPGDTISVMELRTAILDDLDTILEHRLAMFRDMGHDDPRELAITERVSRAYFESAIPGGTYHAVLAEVEGAGVVGGGGVVVVPWPGSGSRSQPRRPWILNVYVHPQFRRQGIARAIMQALIGWCRSQEFDCICLHATNQGRPLYEELGFGPTNEMRLNLTGGPAA